MNTLRSLVPSAMLILALAAMRTLCSAAEPTYQGKPASYWLDYFETNMPGGNYTAFKAMGTNAVPFLIKTLNHKPSKLGEALDNYPGKIPLNLREVLPSAYRLQSRRQSAVFLLGELGPLAEAAIPTLFAIYCDTNENWRVAGEVNVALRRMGEAGVVLVPDYLRWLKDKDPQIQMAGASFLGTVGAKANVAIPALLKAAESTNAELASVAALALWSIDRQTNVAVRIHTKDLQSTNSTTRELALIYLRKMGPAAAEACSQVEPFLRDPNDVVHREAEKTLREIAPERLASSQRSMNQEADAQIAKLIQMIREGEYVQRYRAVETIAVFGPAAKAAVPALAEALEGFVPSSGIALTTTKMNSQRAVAEALAEIGPEARAAVPGLMARLRENSGNQASFCKALGRIGPDARDAVPLLEGLLQSESRDQRLAAAEALTRITPNQCSNAVTVLRLLQHDPQLAQVWQSLGHGSAVLTQDLNFENAASRYFRLVAAVPLWKLGFEQHSPLPALMEELRKSETSNQLRFIELLGDLGPEAKPALPILTKYLDADNWIGLRRTTANTIRKISPEDAAALNLPGVLAVP